MAKMIGEYDVEASFTGTPMKMQGTATMKWVIPGKWMGTELKVPGMAMGKDLHGFAIVGFDAYKKKHVACYVDSMNTGMYTMEGVVVDKTGKVQVSYGTMDEWLTGEHDKPVKYVTREISDDEWVFEIWDLGIGEKGAIVLTYKYTRKKAK